MINLAQLPSGLRPYIESALETLDHEEKDLDFWEVSDYGIFVMMSESFYKTLKFRQQDPLEFIRRRQARDLPHTGSYPDSRHYLKILIEHFHGMGLKPRVIDVGGFIGRFSIEAALLARDSNIDLPICCLEPGMTRDIIQANLAINELADFVELRDQAASDEDTTAEYKYSPGGLISGRIGIYPLASKHKRVQTLRLESLIAETSSCDAAIIKIDTEGHEPDVMAGLGDLVDRMPMICIVEFWPKTLDCKIGTLPYADYIEANFRVMNIRSSLYPAFYTPIDDIRTFAANFDPVLGNIDLLFVGKAVENADALIEKLSAL